MFPILDTIQEGWHPGEWKGKNKMTLSQWFVLWNIEFISVFENVGF